jgi:hypothetical protein
LIENASRDCTNEEPTLSPDGRSLAYSRWNGDSALWLLSV